MVDECLNKMTFPRPPDHTAKANEFCISFYIIYCIGTMLGMFFKQESWVVGSDELEAIDLRKLCRCDLFCCVFFFLIPSCIATNLV